MRATTAAKPANSHQAQMRVAAGREQLPLSIQPTASEIPPTCSHVGVSRHLAQAHCSLFHSLGTLAFWEKLLLISGETWSFGIGSKRPQGPAQQTAASRVSPNDSPGQRHNQLLSLLGPRSELNSVTGSKARSRKGSIQWYTSQQRVIRHWLRS